MIKHSSAWRLAVALPLVLCMAACSADTPSQSAQAQAPRPLPTDAPATPPPVAASAGAVSTGQYRNLFAEAGYNNDQIKARIDAAFAQLFHGDAERQTLYYPQPANANGPMAYILDVNNNDVRSEGMSYGMMIAVQMDRKQEFDAIWNWAMSHSYQDDPSHPAHGYFAWSVRPDGTPIDEMPAPDGEEYFITALYFASARWGDGEGIYNYRAQADRILHDILHRQEITGATVTNPKATAVNLFDRQAKMVRFTPDLPNAAHTDASYHLPAFYEIWARLGPVADRPFWAEAAQVSRNYIQAAAHPRTGLISEYGNFDATPWAAPWHPGSADFRYDAWRNAMNWSVDWSWWQADPRQVELSNRLLSFFHAQGMDAYVSLYSLDGKPLGGGQTTGLVSMNATAALAATEPNRADFVRALWERPVPEGHHRYYDGMLYMMAMLHCSGRYKAWLPTE